MKVIVIFLEIKNKRFYSRPANYLPQTVRTLFYRIFVSVTFLCLDRIKRQITRVGDQEIHNYI